MFHPLRDPILPVTQPQCLLSSLPQSWLVFFLIHLLCSMPSCSQVTKSRPGPRSHPSQGCTFSCPVHSKLNALQVTASCAKLALTICLPTTCLTQASASSPSLSLALISLTTLTRETLNKQINSFIFLNRSRITRDENWLRDALTLSGLEC